jgi:hypothetical protein
MECKSLKFSAKNEWRWWIIDYISPLIRISSLPEFRSDFMRWNVFKGDQSIR